MDKIKNSLKSNGKGISIMIVASFFTSVGQLLWKLYQQNENFGLLALGFLFYGAGAITMIVAFKFGKYSVIHPVMCTSYIFAIFFGGTILKEYVSFQQILGILSMILGVVFIGGGDE